MHNELTLFLPFQNYPSILHYVKYPSNCKKIPFHKRGEINRSRPPSEKKLKRKLKIGKATLQELQEEFRDPGRLPHPAIPFSHDRHTSGKASLGMSQ